MNSNRYYGINNSGLSKSLEKLSSGFKINRAGDDAAGLAVSEKMRSQIAGITQGVRNAQDGISMIQTFEGALTETDSILQRMKTLADQSANGTYQDDVDRDAIQLEFDQLNDELNQIADTDFNGVIVLNGGEMADGLEAVDGKFDYKNAAGQIADKKAAIEKEIADIQATTPEDVGANAAKWNSVDDIGFNATNAAKMWDDLGIDENVKDVDITFTFDGTTWKATSAKAYNGLDEDGNDVLDTTDKNVAMDDDKKGTLIDDAKIDLSKITVAVASKGAGTGEGGFTVSTSAGKEVANAVFDATDLKVGDTVTLNFANPSGKTYAPKNVGLTDDSFDELNGKFSIADGKGVVSGGALKALTDTNMNQDYKKILDDLNGTAIDLQVAESATPVAGGVSATVKNATLTGASGAVYTLTITNDKLTIANQAAIGGVAASTSLAEIDLGKFTQLAPGTAGQVDTSFKLAFDNYNAADPTKVPDVSMTAGEPDTAAIDAKAAELQDKLAALDKEGVSVSNAYKNAAIPMTYTDHIILQTGARSKDAVDFTFNYSSSGMGELEANMNCSAREDGLGTASLSLRTAKDANHAIDRIDHAINKVSMVRATFGAVQNRLEHKIDNMNVTKENLTSAESRIRDTNIAEEMANFTRNQILSQASQSMLAQANSLPQGALQLLG